jgi:insecticidal toxin
LFSFYSFPSEYILYRLFPVYRPTVISVLLDPVERLLAVPVLPLAWHGKVAYRIQGAGKQCALVLNPGVSLKLESPAGTSRWVLEASWASESDIALEGPAGLQIGTIKVEFTGKGLHDVLIRIADNQLFQLAPGKRQMSLIEQDVPPGMDRQTLQEHFKVLAREHRLVMPYTPVHHYLIPFEKPDEPRYTTAWYDAREDCFLYIRNEEVLASRRGHRVAQSSLPVAAQKRGSHHQACRGRCTGGDSRRAGNRSRGSDQRCTGLCDS